MHHKFLAVSVKLLQLTRWYVGYSSHVTQCLLHTQGAVTFIGLGWLHDDLAQVRICNLPHHVLDSH